MPISQFNLFLYLTVNSGRKFVKQCFLIKLQCESACASFVENQWLLVR